MVIVNHLSKILILYQNVKEKYFDEKKILKM